jgi:hypothetical protein
MLPSSQGRSPWAGVAREDEGRRGGQIQMVQNALDDIELRDDAQDAQHVPTSRHCVTSTAKTRSSEKAERLDEGLGCINQVFWFWILALRETLILQTPST